MEAPVVLALVPFAVVMLSVVLLLLTGTEIGFSTSLGRSLAVFNWRDSSRLDIGLLDSIKVL